MSILKSLSQGEVIAIFLIFLVLVVQFILFFLSKKRIKNGFERLESELKVSTRNEIDRLAGEMITPLYRLPGPGSKIKTASEEEVKLSHRDENSGLRIERSEGSESPESPEKVISISPGSAHTPGQWEEEKPTFTPSPEPARAEYQPQGNWMEQEQEPIKPNTGENEKPESLLEEQSLVEQSLDPWVKEYNLALNNEANQNRFIDKYRPVRVDVINALERRRKANLEPVYQTAYNGDYYVIEVQELEQTLYVVLPRFDLKIKESNFKAGAFGEVFECLHYENDSLHRVNRVFESAFFTKKRHENWELLSRGKLDLAFEE